jgi:hypothetical protein
VAADGGLRERESLGDVAGRKPSQREIEDLPLSLRQRGKIDSGALAHRLGVTVIHNRIISPSPGDVINQTDETAPTEGPRAVAIGEGIAGLREFDFTRIPARRRNRAVPA